VKDNRTALAEGSQLDLAGVIYTIIEVMGRGSNAICYKARYKDDHIKHKYHSVLIKELYPLVDTEAIQRAANGFLIIPDEAQPQFVLHRQSFIRGSMAGIDVNEYRPDKSMQTINTSEANNTIYCIIGVSGGTPLAPERAVSLRTSVDIVIEILHALRPFHEKNLLHLDIGPDNILLMPKDKDESGQRALLIDYNSVFAVDELSSRAGFYFSIKKPYTAPEVTLGDISSIGFGTDLYSAVSVLCSMISPGFTGDPAEITPSLAIFRDIPQTAIHKTIATIRKGLALSPKRRYKTIDDLLCDLRELKNRIESAGVTLPALWEASAAAYKHEIAANPLFCHLNNNEIPSQLSLEDIHGDTLITGGGGMGKTTTMLRIWRNGVATYDPSDAVLVFIRLSSYNKAGYIRMRCLDRLRFINETTTIDNALAALNDLFDSGTDTDPSVIFLLDGYNEVQPEVRDLLVAEINELRQRNGVMIIISSRADDEPVGFKHIGLAPLDHDFVKGYFSAAKLLYPGSTSIQELLRNPMMLTMYVRVAKNSHSYNEDYTEATLIRAYFDYIIDKSRNPHASRFAIDYILALAAASMAKNNVFMLGNDELFALAEKSYEKVKSKLFLKVFAEYISQTGMILNEAETADEWFSYIVVDVLTNELALLSTESGQYSFTHQLFKDELVSAGYDIITRFRKIRMRRALPRAAAGLLIAVVLIGGIVFIVSDIVSKSKSDPVIAGTVVGNAIDQSITALKYLDEHISFSSEIILMLESYENITEPFAEEINRKLSETSGNILTLQDTERMLNQLRIENRPLSVEVLDILRELYAFPAEYYDTNKELIGDLIEYWNYLKPEERVIHLQRYDDWMDTNANLAVVKMRYIISKLPETANTSRVFTVEYKCISKYLLNSKNPAEYIYADEKSALEGARRSILGELRKKEF